LDGGFERLTVITLVGFALDLIRNRRGDVDYVPAGERRLIVSAMLEEENGSGLWPTLGDWTARTAFADQLSAIAGRFPHRHPERQAAMARADAAGVGERWREVADFIDRYRARLSARGQVDTSGALTLAGELLADGPDPRFDHVLVDDVQSLGHGAADVLVGFRVDSLTVGGHSQLGDWPALDGERLALSSSFRQPSEPAAVICRHPSVEGEAVVGELLAAHADGVPWTDLAVLVGRSHRAGTVGRALERHGIPVGERAAPPADEPAVSIIVDALRAAAAIEDSHEAKDPAALAHRIFRTDLTHLVPDPGGPPPSPADDRALDAVTGFLGALDEHVERHPETTAADVVALFDGPGGAWLRRGRSRGRPSEGVTVVLIDDAAGRSWHTVVIAGCIEGELPRISGALPFFDLTLLDGTPTDTRLAAQRARFQLAATRGRNQVIGVAAPQPGELVSRFIEAWPERDAKLAFGRGPADSAIGPLEPTANPVPVYPIGELVLSASQLGTYADCPLRFAFSYPLRARTPAGLWADFGSLVHGVLAEFLNPEIAGPRTWDRLVEIAEDHWTDDIAPYRPQREEARRDLFDMLRQWFDAEVDDQRPPVLATELKFTVEVGPHQLTGAIDRIDRTEDGEGVEIVDYKTGSRVPTDEEAADDIQLAVYHLAASRDPDIVAFGRPTRLRLQYLRRQVERDQPITPDHVARTEDRILTTAARMLAEDFTPSVDADCSHCDYHRLCPLQPEGREVSA
jgi:RecB family exonuclease